jgi:hypothetical protein
MVTTAQFDKFQNIPEGLDYLRTCIDTWSDGDEAQALEALRMMKKDREDLDRRITEIEGRLTKKTSAEDQTIAKVVAEFKSFGVGARPFVAQKDWVSSSVGGDIDLMNKVLAKLYPNGLPREGPRMG